jgi:hypothetical protein
MVIATVPLGKLLDLRLCLSVQFFQRRLEAGIARRLNVEPVGNAHLLNNLEETSGRQSHGGRIQLNGLV